MKTESTVSGEFGESFLSNLSPSAQYLDLMKVLRSRFELISVLQEAKIDSFSKGETAAFHARKIVEGIAFGCLIAVENGLNHVPRDSSGQWNAEVILTNLQKKNINVFPSPSVIRESSPEERAEHNVSVVVEGMAERRISHNELKDIYVRLHKWLHEINPYVEKNRNGFLEKNQETLWKDIAKLRLMMEKHFISISGKGFYCTLWDSRDGITKILPLEKSSEDKCEKVICCR